MSALTGDTQGVWNVDSLYIHQTALRQADHEMALERDMRYREGAELRAVALKIKETADLAALTLARESQTYKEQQNDALRDKNLSESGIYATNTSLTTAIDALKKSQEAAIDNLAGKLQPFIDVVMQQQGAVRGNEITMGKLYAAIGAVTAIIVAAVYVFKL